MQRQCRQRTVLRDEGSGSISIKTLCLAKAYKDQFDFAQLTGWQTPNGPFTTPKPDASGHVLLAPLLALQIASERQSGLLKGSITAAQFEQMAAPKNLSGQTEYLYPPNKIQDGLAYLATRDPPQTP